MSTVITVDPGLDDLALAVWEDGELAEIRYVKNTYKTNSKIDGKRKMYQMAVDFARELSLCRMPDVVVLEMSLMGKWQSALSRMLFVSGASVGLYIDQVEFEFVTPSQWKTNKDKKKSQQHYLKMLTETEKKVLDKYLKGKTKAAEIDILDAVAIGKWYHSQEDK